MNPPFQNPWQHPRHRVLDILKWKLRIGPRELPRIPDAPDEPAPWTRLAPERIALPPELGWRVAWLGHSSFLAQGCGVSLLVDPVFAAHCGPFPVPGLFRRIPPPCGLDDLPGIDAVLLTHSHYDHLDLSTLRKLGARTRLVVPDGHAAWLRKKGFENVTQVPWGGSVPVGGELRLTATPAQHFTARSPWDRDRGHWCGWLIEGAGLKLWHAGDSGYCPAFREIGERHGPIDFGMIPIGAYQPRRIMKPVHLDPEEAVEVFVETRCRRAVGMHWGTFPLTDEPLGEPPMRLARALQAKRIPAADFTAGMVGEVWEIAPHLR